MYRVSNRSTRQNRSHRTAFYVGPQVNDFGVSVAVGADTFFRFVLANDDAALEAVFNEPFPAKLEPAVMDDHWATVGKDRETTARSAVEQIVHVSGYAG